MRYPDPKRRWYQGAALSGISTILCVLLGGGCPAADIDPPSDPACPALPPRCAEPWKGQCSAAMRGTECSRKPGDRWEICYCDEDGRFYCRDCACGSRGAPAKECRIAGEFCSWSSTLSCSCVLPEHSWVCCGREPASCPAQRPVENSPCGCNVGGLLGPGSCEYECTRCTCETSHWRCQPLQPSSGCDGGG